MSIGMPVPLIAALAACVIIVINGILILKRALHDVLDASTVNAAGAPGNLPGRERFSVHGPGFSSQIFLSGPSAP